MAEMGQEQNRAVCAECGYEFADSSNLGPCPQCGGTRRQVHLTMREGLKLREGFVLETRWPGWKRFVRRIIDRAKLSRQGREAHEVLEIDRSDHQKTKKYHRVDELVDGQWETVHEHREEADAKRRPPPASNLS
jgi:predicted  nucleic acid-binding Zn-ribbon protein